MDTGENSQGLQKVLELTRIISIALLLLHFYYVGYDCFERWKITSIITDRLLINVEKTGLFDPFNKAKFISLGFLALVLVGARGKKDERIKWLNCLICLGAGLSLYFVSIIIWQLNIDIIARTEWYIIVTSAGYLLILTGGTLLSRIVKQQLGNDVFNKENETFRGSTIDWPMNIP